MWIWVNRLLWYYRTTIRCAPRTLDSQQKIHKTALTTSKLMHNRPGQQTLICWSSRCESYHWEKCRWHCHYHCCSRYCHCHLNSSKNRWSWSLSKTNRRSQHASDIICNTSAPFLLTMIAATAARVRTTGGVVAVSLAVVSGRRHGCLTGEG